MTITVKYEGYTKVTSKLSQMVTEVLEAAKGLSIPTEITLIIHNTKSSTARANYIPRDIVVGGRIITKGQTIHMYSKSISTDASFRFTLAHEFGHAEHYNQYPESYTWTHAQQETYADATAMRILHLN